jgi:hypothetical protein
VLAERQSRKEKTSKFFIQGEMKKWQDLLFLETFITAKVLWKR